MSGTTAITITTNSPLASRADSTAVSFIHAHDDDMLSDWADYVDHSPDGTLFHHPDWCDVVRDVFKHKPRHALAMRDGAVVGVLPLFEINSFLAGKMLVSVPYATFGGILADDQSARLALFEHAREATISSGARSLELRSAVAAVPGLIDDERYADFTRELPLRVDELPTYLPRKARAAARQALQRENLTTRHDAALLPVVWSLYARGMRRLASINYPYSFFEGLARRLGNRAWTTVVFSDETPVAGLLSFVYRDLVCPYFVGIDERARVTGAANLLYYSVMERAVRAGLHRFDFGRSRKDNPGSYNFKKNQGFGPRTLGYQRFVPEGRTPPDLTPNNPRFSLARRVWPRLPLGLTKPLGAWLSKSIPG